MGSDPKTPPETRAPRRGRMRLVKRFRRDEKGVTAVEFGFVATPFFMLLFAVIETGLMLWTNEILAEAVTATSRSLLTGQSRSIYNGSPAANAAAFRSNICSQAGAMVDCSKLVVDVRSYGSFSNAQTGTNASNPLAGGRYDTSGFSYSQPTSGQIVVVRAALEYSLYFTRWSTALANIGGGKRAIIVSATFRAEPF